MLRTGSEQSINKQDGTQIFFCISNYGIKNNGIFKNDS